jgi:hypothetical protein
MDPEYLDVWKKILSTSDELFLSQQEQDATILRLLARTSGEEAQEGVLAYTLPYIRLWSVGIQVIF